jgi:hypothetical protein
MTEDDEVFDPAMDRLDRWLYESASEEPDFDDEPAECVACLDVKLVWRGRFRRKLLACTECSVRPRVRRRHAGRAIRRSRRRMAALPADVRRLVAQRMELLLQRTDEMMAEAPF